MAIHCLGRGGEELEVLFDADIPFQVVPGIAAAAGATAYAGIPLTHRDYAQTAMFVTGHLALWRYFGLVNTRTWKTNLSDLHGLDEIESIQQQLLEHGRGADTPIAIIERGTQKPQKF